MLRVLVILPLTLIACSPDRPATTAFRDVDLSADPQQTQDHPGAQWSDLNAAAPKAQTSSSAWLEPSPSSFSFTADDSSWKTFTVRTSSDLDSVLVVVNPTGKDKALEVAGGSRPPSRNFCPAESNDSPTRARRNGWSLHLSACAAGETEVVYDLEGVELARYTIEVAEQFEPLSEPSDYPEHWMDDLPDHAVFNIELVFLDDFSQRQKDEMRWAADLWELAFTDELPDADIDNLQAMMPFNDIAFPCGDHFIEEPSGVIDDVKVYVAKHKESWFLAVGGPSLNRIVDRTTVLGCIQMADDPFIHFDHVFAHELGHVLGIGTSGFVYDTNSEHHVIASSTLYYEYAPGTAESDKRDTHTYLIAPEAQRAFKEMGDWPTEEIPLAGGHWAQYPLGNSVMALGNRTIFEPRITKVDLGLLSDLGYSVGDSPTKPVYFLRAVPFANGEYELEGWNLAVQHPRWFSGKPVADPGVGRDRR